jgi:hypothetical protein
MRSQTVQPIWGVGLQVGLLVYSDLKVPLEAELK